MGDNFWILADRRLDELTLPGTHDSAAFALAPPASSGPFSPSPRDRVLSFLARFARPCIAPWTLTQDARVYEQLSHLGIRFLDVRVAWNASDGRFVTSHTFACAPLADVLGEVVDFLRGKRHAREVVLVSLRPDWLHRAGLALRDRVEALLREVSAVCGSHLYPRAASLPSLGEMVASGRRMLVFVEGVPSPDAELEVQPDAELEVKGVRLRDLALTPQGSGRHAGKSCICTVRLVASSGQGVGDRDSPEISSGKRVGGCDGCEDGGDVWLGAGCCTIWADSDTPAGTVQGLLEMIGEMRRDGRLPASACAVAGSTAGSPARLNRSLPNAARPCNAMAGPAHYGPGSGKGRTSGGDGCGAGTAALYWYVSAAVTPSVSSMVRSVLSDPRDTGLRRLASRLEAEQLPALLAEGLAGVGAVCLDYPSAAAVQAVVQLNLAPRCSIHGQ